MVLFDDPEEDPYEPPIVGPESKKVRKGSDVKKSKTKISKESYETTFQSFIKSKGAKPAKDGDANWPFTFYIYKEKEMSKLYTVKSLY